MSIKVELEFEDAKSHKFWHIEQADSEVTTRWGRAGTCGQVKVKVFSSPSDAEAQANKQVGAKRKKGYREVPIGPTERASETTPSVTQKHGVLVLSTGDRLAHLRYVEIERERERVEGESSPLDRVTAQLQLQLDRTRGGVPAKTWVVLLELYCHDSYDGENRLVAEDGYVHFECFEAIAEELEVDLSPRELTSLVSEHTGYEAGFTALLANSECWEKPDEAGDVVLVEASSEVPYEHEKEDADDVSALLARAQRLIEEGIHDGERIDAYDAFSSDYDGAPKFREAQECLKRVDQVDEGGRGHELRGSWYDRLEHQYYPRCAYETSNAWARAVKADPTNLDYVRRAAYAHVRVGAWAKSIKLLNQLIKADKQDAHAYFLRACCHLQMGKSDRALKQLDKAIALDPDDVRFYRCQRQCAVHQADRDLEAAAELAVAELDQDLSKNRFEAAIDAATLKAIDRAIDKADAECDVYSAQQLWDRWQMLARRVR